MLLAKAGAKSIYEQLIAKISEISTIPCIFLSIPNEPVSDKVTHRVHSGITSFNLAECNLG